MGTIMSAGAPGATATIDGRITKKMLQALAPLPDTAVRLLALLDDPNVSMREIANTAVRDVGISATMLRMANSAMFGLRGRIGSISDALRVIGTAQARLLVLASGVSQAAQKELPVYGLEAGAFLSHSELVANLTMQVAHELHYANIGSAYSAGLLHDIGKIVINGAARQAGEPGLILFEREMERRGCTLREAEQAVCGNDHAQVGKVLTEMWSLPVELTRAVALHHEVHARDEGDELAYCVAVADAVAIAANPSYPALHAGEPPVVADDAVDMEKLLRHAEELVKG